MARKVIMAIGAGALALLMVSALSFPVEARHGGGGNGGRGGHGGGWSGNHGFRGGHHGDFRSGHRFNGTPFAHRNFHHRRFHGRAFIDGPYYYDYGYNGGCSWLRRRALYTGSGYWWNRYYACLSDYDY